MTKGIDRLWVMGVTGTQGLPDLVTNNRLPWTFPLYTYVYAFASSPYPGPCTSMLLDQSQGNHVTVKSRWDRMPKENRTGGCTRDRQSPDWCPSSNCTRQCLHFLLLLFIHSWKNLLFPKQNSNISMVSASSVWRGHKSQPDGGLKAYYCSFCSQ